MTQNKVVSFTTADLESAPYQNIPDEILEYRTLDKTDIENKVIEARQELSQLKNVPIDINDIKEAFKRKGHYALCSELYALRNIIKDAKVIVEKARLKAEQEQKEEAERIAAENSKPKKNKEDEETEYAIAKEQAKPRNSPKKKG